MITRPERLISLAAGVSPELAEDPVRFVSIAAETGWPATGIWFDEPSWAPSTTRKLASILDDTGLITVDMEVVRMGTDKDRGEALIDTAVELGVRNVLTVSSFDDPNETADRFATLCQRAAPAGLKVCIEFMRFTAVKTLSDALDIVVRSGQPNAGILVDLLHVFRSGTTYEDVRSVDPALFPYAQWCDGPTDPRGWSTLDLITDALDDRSIPGRGDLDAAGFRDLFTPEVPFSIEVRSRALRETFPDHAERARELLTRTKAALTT